VIAVDRYPGAPAMQVAHRSHVVNMLDADALRRWWRGRSGTDRARDRGDRHGALLELEAGAGTSCPRHAPRI
jgi:hypothetical protein